MSAKQGISVIAVILFASLSAGVPAADAPVEWDGLQKTKVRAPDGGPDWGVRFVVTLLFPK